MSKVEFKKPNKSQVIKVATTTVGGAAGYLGYDMLTQKVPVTKEMNLAALGGSILGLGFIKGSGMGFNALSAILMGVTVGSAVMALEDYNIIKSPVAKVLAPVADANLADADGLNAIFDEVEYVEDAVLINDDDDIQL